MKFVEMKRYQKEHQIKRNLASRAAHYVSLTGSKSLHNVSLVIQMSFPLTSNKIVASDKILFLIELSQSSVTMM